MQLQACVPDLAFSKQLFKMHSSNVIWCHLLLLNQLQHWLRWC